MSARKSNTQSRVEREVREERAREQPVAKWRRDSDSVLQLLASPLVSRSPSPVSEADEEATGEISDVELPSEEEDPGADATEIAEVVAISSDESGPEDASEEEEDGTETVSPEVSSDEDDVARRAARDRMIFRRLSRATAGLGRICLGQIPPSGEPKEWAAEEARMREAIEAIEWRRPPPLSPRDPRARSTKRVAETADRAGLEVTTEEEREAQEGLEKGPREWPTPPETSRDTAPPPEAGAADFVPGVASPTGEADAAETAVGGRGTVGGGSGGGLAGAGGRRCAATAREAEEGQVGQARAGGGTALPSQVSRGPGAGV
ncbi:polycomb group protein ASXL1-like [Drosophila elegans]|uniref:polycomb group protein ASXL1-like n=1 Tax=Drosophila elegans TaxID=30023 RepID=UPI001BC83633|nr:polycomb group protein ASXL1-like [Drosophila elegans]